MFDAQIGVGTVAKRYETLNPYEFATLYNTYRKETFSPEQLSAFQNGTAGTDWLDEIFQNGITQDYKLTLSGGSDKIQYIISGNYVGQEGVVKENTNKRYQARANITSQLTDWLHLTADVNASHNVKRSADFSAAKGNIVNIAMNYAPVLGIMNEDGTYTRDPYSAITQLNPVGLLNEQIGESMRDIVNAHIDLKFNILPGLTFTTSNGIDYNDVKNYSFATTKVSSSSSMSNNDAYRMTLQTTNNLTYNGKWGDHALTATAVYEATQSEYRYMNISGNNLMTESVGWWNVEMAGTRNAKNDYSKWALMSGVGRVMYNYKDRYMLTATLRTDGSSKFAAGHRWGYFPAASAGWVVSKEGFWPQNSAVSMLKARVSYGLTGNNGIGLYDTYGSYNSLYTYNGNATTTTNTMPNNGLIWEKTLQFNAGIDLGLLDNRITLALDYYNKETRDLLFDVSLPNTTGYNSVSTNLGRVRFYGTELSLSSVNIDRKGFSWRTDFTYSYNMNRVLELPDNGNPRNRINGISVGDGSQFGGIGERMGRIFGYVAERIIETQEEADAARYDTQSRGYRRSDRRQIAGRKDIGDYEWKDRPGSTRMDGRQIINAEDQFLLGYALPHSTGGIGNTFRYRNWTLNVYMDYALGHSVRNDMQMRYFQSTMGNCNYNLVNEVKKCWSQPGDDTRYARFTANDTDWGNRNYGRTSDIFVEKADYLCLRDVSLSWSLPKAWLRKLHISDVTLTVSGNTLCYWTAVHGVSPEAATTGGLYTASSTYDTGFSPYPPTRKVLFTAKLTF